MQPPPFHHAYLWHHGIYLNNLDVSAAAMFALQVYWPARPTHTSDYISHVARDSRFVLVCTNESAQVDTPARLYRQSLNINSESSNSTRWLAAGLALLTYDMARVRVPTIAVKPAVTVT